MVETYLRQSPLSHLGLEARARLDTVDAAKGAAGVVMAERPFRGVVNLRGEGKKKAFAEAFQTAMGCALPVKPLTSASEGKVVTLWLSPDEWLVVTPDDGPATEATLRQAFDGQHVSVVDVSDNHTVVEISGARARDVLLKGCSLDLHPSEWPAGKVGGTLIAKANVVIHRSDDGADDANPRFELYVRRSFAEYLWLWLEDASREYGLRITG